MERNLDRRVEVLVPVTDADLRTHLRDVVLGALLKDTARAWLLKANGRYERATPGRRQHTPRTMRSIGTPACDAR
jgi:polyphosphate kinase